MFKKILSSRRLTITFCVFLIFASILIFKDAKDPSCADAQTCVKVYPEILLPFVGFRNLPNYGKCETFTVTSPGAFINNIDPNKLMIILEGWELRHNNGSCDGAWYYQGKVAVNIGTIQLRADKRVQFDVQACFNDINPNNHCKDDAEVIARFSAVGWE